MSAVAFGADQRRGSLVREAVTSPLRASWQTRFVALYIMMMPIIAGIPRGKIVPMLRLTEVVQVGLSGLAVLVLFAAYSKGQRWRLVIQPLDWWMIAFAFFGSVVPIVSLIARGQMPDLGAVAAAFPVLKYLLLWLLVRFSVRTIADITTVLFSAVFAGCFVALLAIPEGLGIGPTGSITRGLVSSSGSGFSEGRAFTLLGSAISSGAVISFCAAITFGLVVTQRSVLAAGATGFLLVGVLATGQTSSLLGILVVLAVAAWQHRVMVKSFALGLPVLLVASLAMAPIIQARLSDAASRSLVPQSWLVRWVNVTELYWPQISDGGWIIGVHPNTVLLPPDSWRSEVFLESGYLWTLWVGGLPLLIAFVGFMIAAWRKLGVQTTDPMHEVVRVAARSAIAFMAIFNLIDPHLVLRGGADLLYVLIPTAMAFAPAVVPCTRRIDTLRLVAADLDQDLSPTARIQLGEIGGSLLGNNGWPSVSPGNGQDRGIDIAVNDRGVRVGEARVYFESDGGSLDGIMLHPVRSIDAEAEALVWRGIALASGSMRLRSLMVPPGTNGLAELSRGELVALAAETHRLENERFALGRPNDGTIHMFAARTAPATPTGVRLEPPTTLSRVRRVVDVVLAGGGLIAFAPFALIIAFLIRRSSPGPVFFRQMRVGAGGRPFPVLKFRSMDNSAGEDVHRKSIVDSLAGGGPDVKVSSDARITRVGGFLRAWSLDEIPQLINVLRGDMTLVGPRPSLLWETSLFEPRTRRRLQMTPGIAGLWQASGRGDLSTEEMLELDLEYADSASLSNDAKLMAQTAVAVVKKTGAR